MDDRRQRSLCFWCDENFVPGHECRKRQLYMLTINTDDLEETGLLAEEEVCEGRINTEYLMAPQLSLHALAGTYNYQIMRISRCKGSRALFY